MKHKIMFSGMSIDLNQTDADVMQNMQAAIDKYFPSPNTLVRVTSYKETGADSIEFEIERRYDQSGGMAFGGGFVCDQDESLLTGLSIDAFQPFKPGRAIVAPMIPWHDGMVYTPDTEFCRLWKQMNKVMLQENIRKIKVIPTGSGIIVRVKYA